MARTKFVSRRSIGWTAAALLVACCGCASFKEETESRDESFTEAAQYERKAEKTTLPFAVTDRGRSIEKDFGVRR